ncbi:MAG TPA: LD-carboxypeptidase [Ferruginibacter sp.]|nr:LD-carboxypeptidase [Ferruginibacter sp.]
MKRKDFLSSVVPLAASFNSMTSGKVVIDSDKPSLIPPYLQKGDTIGICSPAGYITLEDIQPAVLKLNEWGYNTKAGDTIGKRAFTFGGTDEERTRDLQQMLDDKNIKAIMCARGGYGAVRIVDRLDLKKFKADPKWIIGFSDVTVLHSHINQNYRVASIHSKMCNSFPEDWSKAEPMQIETIESIRKCLSGEKMNYMFAPNPNNKTGVAVGELIGGNLKTLESLSGSRSDIRTKDKILFVEDTGEYLYSIDRMFWNLKRSDKLSGLKGLVVGGFKVKTDDAGEEFGKTLAEIVLEKVSEYNYPVCFDFPVGHQKNNFALKCGVKHTVKIDTNECSLTETR